MARPRKLPPQTVTDDGRVVFRAETAEDVLVADLTDQQAREERKAAKKAAPEPPAVPPTAEEMASYTPDGDLVDIWQRRMINPNMRQAGTIRIKIPGLHLRWINLSNNGRYQRARFDEGWVPVRKAELVDEHEIYGASYTVEGYVCRGEKQTEMLMKIPEAVWKQIRSRKHAQVEKSNKEIKDQLEVQGSQHFSDKYNANKGQEIGETARRFKGDIKFGTEQVDPETEADAAGLAAE